MTPHFSTLQPPVAYPTSASGVPWRRRGANRPHVGRSAATAAQIQAAVNLALAAERLRLRADLHDDLGGALAILAARSDDPAMAAVARTALSNMRSLLAQCSAQPVQLANALAGLRSEIAQGCELSGVALNWQVAAPSDATLSPRLWAQLQRVVREAATNALRHSACSQIQVSWQVCDTQVAVQVCDNGKGFAVLPSSSSGLGLASMRERIARLGGRITLTTAPGAGVRLACELVASSG